FRLATLGPWVGPSSPGLPHTDLAHLCMPYCLATTPVPRTIHCNLNSTGGSAADYTSFSLTPGPTRSTTCRATGLFRWRLYNSSTLSRVAHRTTTFARA